MTTNPAPTALAADIARIVNFPCNGKVMISLPKPKGMSVDGPRVHYLDPRAFAAVVAALPPEVVEDVQHVVGREFLLKVGMATTGMLIQYLLTSTGMTAFYRAVVRLSEEDKNDG